MTDNNHQKDKDNSRAGMGTIATISCVLIAFGVLFLVSCFASDEPLDFMLEILGTIVGYILLVGIVVAVISLIFYYYNLSVDDADKPVVKRSRKDMEMSREKAHEIAASIRSFYEEYRAKKADADAKKKKSKK